MRLLKFGDVAVILMVLLSAFFVSRLTYGHAGKTVMIYSDSRLFGQYSLLEEKDLTVDSDFGWNRVIISGKKVWVEEASCTDKRDVSQGAISKSGQSIICLPNRLVVTIEGEADFDVLSY